MEIKDHHWKEIRRLFRSAFKTSLHYSLATVNSDGSPHITPIGSVVLRDDKTGFYCEGFPRNIPTNLQSNPRVCVMAVNAGKRFWFMSLFRGRFDSPPGVRLIGRAGEKRKGTDQELTQWQKRIRPLKKLKGYDLLWKDLNYVRDLYFDGFEPIHAGLMTKGLWRSGCSYKTQ
ncbi:pyridoxamine 5'-phosphate oxidase family protein [Thermodesulfobacteriota bacterium]